MSAGGSLRTAGGQVAAAAAAADAADAGITSCLSTLPIYRHNPATSCTGSLALLWLHMALGLHRAQSRGLGPAGLELTSTVNLIPQAPPPSTHHTTAIAVSITQIRSGSGGIARS
jgi:hypothetical protein